MGNSVKAIWWQQPWSVAMIVWVMMALLALAYVSHYDFNFSALVRFGNASMSLHGDAERFRRELPPRTVILSNYGYDGQMYYWLSTHLPFSADGVAHIDYASRYQRVAFPLLSWVIGGGRGEGILWAMIAFTLFVPGVMTWAVAATLRDSRVSAWWAIAVGINTGTVLSLYFCTPDSFCLMFLVLGWLAYEKGTKRSLAMAVLWWNVALLAREQTLTIVALVVVWEGVHGRVVRAALLSLSGLGVAVWQGYLTLKLGHIPLLMTKAWLTWPMAGVLQYLRGLPHPALDKPTLLAWSNTPIILIAVVCLLLGLKALRKSGDHAGLQLAWTSILFLSLGGAFFEDSITGAGRVGIGLFFFLVLLLRSQAGTPLKGTVLTSLLLGATVAIGLYYFPVAPYFLT